MRRYMMGLRTEGKGLLKDLCDFMKAWKNFWFAPVIVMLPMLGVLIVLSRCPVVAPFTHTLF
jgi:hypothetical protein